MRARARRLAGLVLRVLYQGPPLGVRVHAPADAVPERHMRMGRGCTVRSDWSALRRRRRRPRRSRRPLRCSLLNAVLWALSTANVATFVVALWRNGWQIEALGSNPLVGPSAAALRSAGALDSAAVVDARHELWRLVSGLFVCSGASPAVVVKKYLAGLLLAWRPERASVGCC